MYAHTPIDRSALRFLAVCLLGLSGCGTSIEEILYQTAGAAGRTFLDLALTDFANTVADSLEQSGAAAEEAELDDDDGGSDTIPPDGSAIEELTGDLAAGEGSFASNGCTVCHCADAAGGCALDAPSLVGVETETLDDRLRGDAAHPGGKFELTNQSIVDLQAYLANLAAQ